MKAFVSGVAGFLGSHLAEGLRDAGHEVAGCDTLLSGDRSNVPDGVAFHEADACDPDAMRRLTRGAELVYHCAAVATEGLSIFSPAIVSRNCYDSTAGLLAGCLENGVRRFVLLSSMARYGAGPVPFREEQPLAPEDPYGIAKVASEWLTRNLCETHGVEYVIAVPHNIYGPRQKYDDPYRNVAGIFMNRILQGKPPLIYGDGEQKRTFSYVSDCVTPLLRLGLDPGLSGEVFNIGPDDEFVTVNALARLLLELMESGLDPGYLPGRLRDVPLATCAADKARARLGYAPTVSLREGMTRTIAWTRERGPRPFDWYLPVEIPSPRVPGPWTARDL